MEELKLDDLNFEDGFELFASSDDELKDLGKEKENISEEIESPESVASEENNQVEGEQTWS